ncbi:Crp/Fnr family transcriptional regulator [Aquimarina sp. 2201CG5-10]|uniref:Crp/Fnr family transcriptional regulator n=1 Tax=Aquimarina callyspongiae TaxID=3098150 RepID=UPI002AB4F314|nr:Crp/Fnr family transcriptional regulator [Aquimarina sp. 2201CG5-10]MDY8135771.1 Crp/Fnr family transcriptional regulator [Aquimarina sp. 2201CG5-10]
MKTTLLNLLIKQDKYVSTFYKQNEIILENRSFFEKIYFIIEGSVKITHITDTGEEIIPMILTKGQIFGADIIYGNFYASFTYKAMNERTILYEFDIRDVKKAIGKDIGLYKDLLLLLKEEYTELEKRIKVLSIRSAEQRFIETLMEFWEKFESSSSDTENVLIDSPFNQNELSDYIRTSRVTTNCIINKFRNKSLLRYRNKRIVIKKGAFDFFE